MSKPTTSAELPFDFAQIRRSAYELLAQLSMDFENGKPDENVRYRAPVRALEQLSRLVGGAKPPHPIFNGQWSSNPFGDGVTFHRPNEPITNGFLQWREDGTTFILEEPAPPSDVRVRASRLTSDRDAFALQRLWDVASELQSYFGLDPLILEVATNEPRRQSPNARERGEPLPSHIIPRLQEAIRLLDERHPASMRPALETWLTILTDLDKKFPSFRPTIEFDTGPRINEQCAGDVTGHSGTTPTIPEKPFVFTPGVVARATSLRFREKPETQAFRPLRRLASGLVPLLESVGISLPDDAGSTPDGRLLFWAWHVHNGTKPTLPSWEIELEKVLPGLGVFAIIKSAIIASVNPDGTAKASSPTSIRKLVTIQQVAKRLFHIGASSMTPYVREWGDPVIQHSGRVLAKYDLEVIRPTLERQLKKRKQVVTDNEWKALEADATES